MKYFRILAVLVPILAMVLGTNSAPAQGQSDFVYLRSDSDIYGFSVSSNGSIQPVPGSPFDARGFDSTSSGFYGANRIIVNGDFLYASNGNSANIGVFSIDRLTGSLSSVPGSPFPLGESSIRGTSLGVTPDNRYLYAVNLESGRIKVYSVSLGGMLTMIAPFS